MSNDSQIVTIDGVTVRLRVPEGSAICPVILLLHGWTGDENSMWIFVSRFPKDHLLILPRGLFPAPSNGYGWHPQLQGDSPQVEDFTPSVMRLLDILTPVNFPRGNISSIHLAGFSQGAALAYTLALSHPERVRSIAGLSGFLPESADSLIEKHPLQGKKVFIAHGTRDNLVPVEKARLAASDLEWAGAQVTYCEDNVGHKLSLNCFRGLQAFYSGQHC